MGKYVCDYDTLKSVANSLNNIATSMESETKTYLTNLNNATNSWNGETKNNFIISNENQVAKINDEIVKMKSLAEFINKTVEKIQSADDSLSSLSI